MEILNYVEKFEVDGNKHGRYGIKLSPMSNTIRFTAKYDNAICAYIVGDFNDWEKSEEFKLTWQLDIEDGTLKMIKDVKFENGLEEGQYRYKYILLHFILNLFIYLFDFYGNICSIWKFPARGRIKAATSGLCPSHSNSVSEPHQ